MSFRPEKPNYSLEVPLKNLSLSEAKKKLMDLLAIREHSDLELREKLTPFCNPETVAHAVSWANQQSWRTSPEKLKNQLADKLSRQGKGIKNINQKLNIMGLEPVKSEFEVEYKKAKKLVLSKWASADFNDKGHHEAHELKTKIMRYLVARGFELSVINSILKEELKYSASSEEEVYDEEF